MNYGRNMKLSYSWTGFDSDSSPELTTELKEHLDEHAMDRMLEMIKEGYTGGELCHTIEVNEEEITFSGWWDFQKNTC